MGRLLNSHEMAVYLGVKQSTIYQWTHTGYIPHIKLGKFVRFREADINKWLDKKATRGRKGRRIDVEKLGI